MKPFALPASTIAAAIREACRAEVRAFKPGNVSVASEGHGMRSADFLASADAVSATIALDPPGVGARILRCIEATRAVISFNTNLGIVLLCAPLVEAAARALADHDLRTRVCVVLDALDVEDAQLAYRAIRLARPGGLGHSQRHDVAESPQVTLLDAMREARDRDRIALQYATGYRDIFDTGVPALREALARWGSVEWAAVRVYLEFLARHADSHVVRKHGAETAAAVTLKARELNQALGHAIDPVRKMPALAAFDRQLKAKSVNPGTSADLTVAVLAAADLQDSLDKAALGSRAGAGASG